MLENCREFLSVPYFVPGDRNSVHPMQRPGTTWKIVRPMQPTMMCVEINIAWDDAYQIRFDLGERGGKRIVDTNLTSYLYT